MKVSYRLLVFFPLRVYDANGISVHIRQVEKLKPVFDIQRNNKVQESLDLSAKPLLFVLVITFLQLLFSYSLAFLFLFFSFVFFIHLTCRKHHHRILDEICISTRLVSKINFGTSRISKTREAKMVSPH